MTEKRIDIKVFVMPVGACSYEKGWQYAVDLISKKLKDRFGDIFTMKLIEVFSPESFEYKEILDAIQREAIRVPVVTLNGRVIQSGGKLSERSIKRGIEEVRLLAVAE